MPATRIRKACENCRSKLRVGAWPRTRGLAALLLLAMASCQDNEADPVDLSDTVSQTEQSLMKSSRPGPVKYRFGFDLRSSPQEDARQLLPFLEYLSKETGLDFELRFTKRGESLSDLVGLGHVQFAAAGAGTYLRTRDAYGAHIIARGLNSGGFASYRSVVATASDSAILKIEDLRGKHLVFGDIDSTQGHIIPRLELRERGIALSDLSSYHFTGSHLDCINAVLADLADACALQETLAERLSEQGLVRIVFRSAEYPSSGVIASKSLPDDVVVKVRQALLKFDPGGKHQEGLYNWHLTEMPQGFTAAEDEDYDRLEEALRSMAAVGNIDERAAAGERR